MKNDKAITLISLVVTIVIIIILATVTISLSIGKNGIFTRAKETKKLQIIAEVKEQIGTQILAAQVDAFARNEELEQSQVEDIISKYGELQEDKDTIILKDNGYEISLLEIYNGTTTETGSYTENKAKIALLENQVATLQKMLDSDLSPAIEGSYNLVVVYAPEENTVSDITLLTNKKNKIDFTVNNDQDGGANCILVIGDKTYTQSGTYDISAVSEIKIQCTHTLKVGCMGGRCFGTYKLY